MATIDIVILIVVLVSALIGLARGLLKEVLSLASWLAALILALYFAPAVSERLSGLMGEGSARLVVAFVLVFLTTLVAGSLLQWMATTLVKMTGMSGTDRFLGFLFGGARGVLASLVVLIALHQFAEAGEWWQSSVLVPELLAFEQEILTAMSRAEEWVTQLGSRG